MAIFIHNSLTRKKEELKPLNGRTIKMYSCGVTVYDKCHIGHARSLYIFDVIRRYLKFRDYDVRFIRNITDVDDKIINKGIETGKSFDEVVTENINAYHRDLKSLGVDEADVEPRATLYIDRIKKSIATLIEKGFAYEAGGNVYYSVRKFKDYGKLSRQSVDQMLEATRIDQDSNKKDPLDFALWKKAKEGEKSWPSQWGEGRPGWHIECSCMSMNELGDQIDIHAGGRDLIFPHHENEIAQSEALSGKKPFAKFWIHHGLLTINGQKMAKSVGNFITLDEVFERYSNDILKLFFLQSHYASPVDFSWEKMKEVKKAWDRFDEFFTEAYKFGKTGSTPPAEEPKFIGDLRNKFFKAMDDDFNTPAALSCLFDLIRETYRLRDHENYSGIIHLVQKTVLDLIQNIFGLFNVGPDFTVNIGESIKIEDSILIDILPSNLSDEEKVLIEERKKARINKDFKRSDEIRDELKKRGIVLKDTKTGLEVKRI